MHIEFIKMNGGGNDFILIDNRSNHIHLTNEQISFICDRHRGIGGDGCIFLERRENNFYMRYCNSNGYEASMCGNGARCFFRFLLLVEAITSACGSFETASGHINAEFLENGSVILNVPQYSDLNLNTDIDFSLSNQNQPLKVYFINTGVPHAVLFVNTNQNISIDHDGSLLRYHPFFSPSGTNVNFVEIQENNPEYELYVRTYERGVEAETLACGTGSIASALIYYFVGKIYPKNTGIRVKTQGGEILTVDFSIGENNIPYNIKLTGKVDVSFYGTIDIH